MIKVFLVIIISTLNINLILKLSKIKVFETYESIF